MSGETSVPSEAGAPARVSASHLYDLLQCPHRVAMDAFGDPRERDPVSPFLELLWRKGSHFERDLLADLGVAFTDLSKEVGDAKERATQAALERGDRLIYGGRLSTEGLLGEPDLLRREAGGYVAIDVKSGAGEEGEEGSGRLKKHYALQLALYTDLLEQYGRAAGRYGYIWDVRGREVRYALDAPLGKSSPSAWELYLQARAEAAAILERRQVTTPASAGCCKLCVWRSACIRVLEREDDLTLLPGLGRASREKLMGAFANIVSLAKTDVTVHIRKDRTDFKGVGPESLIRFHARARLRTEKARPYWWRPVELPSAAVEIFFDIEDDPFRDLVYLHGFVIRRARDGGAEEFIGHFLEAPTPAGEREAFAAAWDLLRRHRDAVVFHYSKHERTKYRELQTRYPQVCGAEEVEALFSPPRSFDLYTDAVRHSEWPTADYSIKSLAKYLGFRWRDADPSGAASIEWFDRWARTGDPLPRQRILEYNEDDCRAMRVLLDALRRLPVRGGGS